jgi:hypothetical protein
LGFVPSYELRGLSSSQAQRAAGRPPCPFEWGAVTRAGGALPQGGHPAVSGPQHRAGLDLERSGQKQKAAAIQILEQQVSSLQQWVDHPLDDVVGSHCPPLQMRSRRFETRTWTSPRTGPFASGKALCLTRCVSIEQAEMRYGLKSCSKRCDGDRNIASKDGFKIDPLAALAITEHRSYIELPRAAPRSVATMCRRRHHTHPRVSLFG